MAEYGALETLTLEAAADLSACQYHAVRISAANKCNLASLSTASSVVGVLLNKPRLGEFATVAFSGKCKVFAGGVVTAGDMIATNGSGRAATVSSGDLAFGRALETAAADGNIITALLFAPGARWIGAAA